MTEAGRCPVCQARFRGVVVCSRCGADLGALMLLATEAWRMRDAARTALRAGEVRSAFALASRAQETQSTEPGDALRRLAQWLLAEPTG